MNKHNPLKLLNNTWDSLFPILLIIQLCLITIGSLCPLKLGSGCIFLFLFVIFLYCTNYQCIAHNFIHNPFFKNEKINSYFSILNSLGIGMPQSLYRLHHLNHHRYNNDMQDLFTHTTNDWSSIYRYSDIPKQPENFWTYAFKSIFRADLKMLYRLADTQGQKNQVNKEIIAIVLFWLILISINFYGFVFFFVPTWFLGQCAAFAENYMEHYRSVPGNRLTDSVSCYGSLYNLIWFNNGYHQEHHFRPNVHWTQIKDIKKEMLPINKRMVVKGAHWFNF